MALINLYGKMGNFEVDSNNDGMADGVQKVSGTATLVSDCFIGSKAQQGLRTNAAEPRTVSMPDVTLTVGKCYLFLGAIKPVIGSGQFALAQYSTGGVIGTVLTSPTITDKTKFTEVYIKVKAATNHHHLNARLVAMATNNAVIMDAVRLYEIDEDTYNKIDVDSEFSGDRLIEKYPSTDAPKTNWTADDKYNSTDFTRVEANTQIVANIMVASGYRPSLGEVKSWTEADIPFLSDINRIENNILLLAQVLNIYPYDLGWNDPVTDWIRGRAFTAADANRMEMNLVLIRELVLMAVQSFKYTGTFACGEEGDIY